MFVDIMFWVFLVIIVVMTPINKPNTIRIIEKEGI